MNKFSIFLLLIIVSSASNSAPITQLTITGGSHALNGDTVLDVFTMGDFADINIGGYDGSAPTSQDYGSTSIVTFRFQALGGSVGTVYTSPTSESGSGFSATSGDITNGFATLDLDSWTVWSSGNIMNLGSSSSQGVRETCAMTIELVENCTSAIIVDSYDPVTGAFTASWDAVHTGESPFVGHLSSWVITGTMSTSVVPVPAAVWLFGSGLLALVGVMRRRNVRQSL